MLHDTPLRKRHEEHAARLATRATPEEAARLRPGAAVGRRVAGVEGVGRVGGVEYLGYGREEEGGAPSCEIPATFGSVEAEYAATRGGSGMLDAAHRGTIRIVGRDRRDFLDRMVTQGLAGLVPGRTAATFWLNRKGRIVADLLLIELEEEMLVDVDLHQAGGTASSLASFVFTEDVEISDCTAGFHRIAVHGPDAAATLAAAGAGAAPEAGAAARVVIGGVQTVVARRDQVGAPGLELLMPYDGAPAVWDGLLAAGDERRRGRPIGWYAYNTARIEAGTPLFNVDFGPNNLPHETGVLADRVSFRKGCYLGQEIVARIETQGQPRQMLVGLRVAGGSLPVAEAQVFERPDGGGIGAPIGVVTSSTVSPMLGAQPIAFAMIRTTHASAGTTVLVAADGEPAEAQVTGLRFWGG